LTLNKSEPNEIAVVSSGSTEVTRGDWATPDSCFVAPYGSGFLTARIRFSLQGTIRTLLEQVKGIKAKNPHERTGGKSRPTVHHQTLKGGP
jgi:hypothetical protein